MHKIDLWWGLTKTKWWSAFTDGTRVQHSQRRFVDIMHTQDSLSNLKDRICGGFSWAGDEDEVREKKLWNGFTDNSCGWASRRQLVNKIGTQDVPLERV